jgi:hypothetical protein
MCSCFNDFIWLSKYKNCCVHLICIARFIWLMFITCTNNGSKIKLSTNRGRITFAWIWKLTGITFAQRKNITIVRKMYLSLFLHLRGFFNIWTVKISVAFKIIVFISYTCMLHIYLFFLIYISYICMLFLYFLFSF